MAKSAKTQDHEQDVKPDFDRTVRIYREDVKPAQARVGEFAQEMSTAFKEIKKGCTVHPGAAKHAFKLAEMDFDKQQEWLRSFDGLCEALNIGLERDLFDAADEEDEKPKSTVRRSSPRKPVDLVTVQ